MEGGGIEHRMVEVNGISMHIAEKGEGPVVVLLHGFPELWYSWRHQILGLAELGYHAVAPDLRGYGDTAIPSPAASYTIFHLVGDIVALIQALGQEKVFVVGHDWGALVAWHLCMFRPDKVKGLVNLSVAPNFMVMAPNPTTKPVDYFRSLYGDDYYICRFQEAGDIEAEWRCLDIVSLFKLFLASRDPSPPLMKKRGLMSLDIRSIPLPSWLSEADVNFFASKFNKTGFTGGINYYRCLDLNWELMAPWNSTGMHIKVPTKFIVGDLDLTYHYPGIQDYIHKGGLKRDVPLLEEVVVMEGVCHFINQEKPHEVTQHIYDFISQF